MKCSSYNLTTGSGIYFLVLLHRHLFQGIHLLILGMYFRAINDDKSISPVYPVSLLNEESVDTAGKFPTDTDFCGLCFSLQNQWLFVHQYHSKGGKDTDD